MGIPSDRDRQSLEIKHLLDKGRHNEASKLISERLWRDPDDFDALFFLCRLLIDTDQPSYAHPVASRMAQKHPKDARAWEVLGMAEAAMQRPGKAILSLKRALKLKPSPSARRVLALAYVSAYRLEDAKRTAEEALKDGDHYLPYVALAFYHLHKREWNKGWEYYRYQLGRCADRQIQDFGLPDWEGEGSVLIYGEQGLGDQLCYTSATDMRCKQLVCHPKLENLLQRSLDIEVHGDQFATEIDWRIKAEHQSSMATAMRWQEMKRRGPWLKAHPEKAVQWEALMHAKATVKDRPWIGLAWTGGRVGSHGWKTRNVTQHDLKPILDLPANFVSLEYKAHENIPNVHQWGWATQTPDLDDFAALVAGLDAVVCVPTTTYHICGSLGIPCHVLVHDTPHFHEGMEGECPWWQSVHLHRRTNGLEEAVNTVVKQLDRHVL